MTDRSRRIDLDATDRLKLALVCGSILVVAGSVLVTSGAAARHGQTGVRRETPSPAAPQPSRERPSTRSAAVAPPVRSEIGERPAATGGSPEPPPAPLPPLEPADRLSATQAAMRIREMALGACDPGDAARLARALADDAALRAELEPVFEALARSEDPEERVRGTLFLAGLDAEGGVYRWREALAGAAAGPIREALLAQAPLSGDPRHDAPYVDTLLAGVERERDEGARQAALHGLPAELPGDSLDRLAGAVLREHAPGLRREAAWVLAGYRSPRPAAVDALRELGGSEKEDLGTRLHALRGLARVEREHPGTLGDDRAAWVRETLAALERDEFESAGPPSPASPARPR